MKAEIKDLVRVVYDSIVEEKENCMICKSGDQKVLLNDSGNEVMRIRSTDRLIDIDSNNIIGVELHYEEEIILINMLNKVQCKLKIPSRVRHFHVISIKDKVIFVVFDDAGLVILNSRFDIIGELTNDLALAGYNVRHYKLTNNIYNIYVHSYLYAISSDYGNYEIKVDIDKESVLYYNRKDILNSDYAAVATEQDEYSKYLKYRLEIHGRVINSKYGYHRIEKPMQLKNTDMFQVYDIQDNTKGKFLTGIIDEQGTEIIKPVYRDIEFIGKDVFLLKRIDHNENSKYSVYSREKGVILNENDVQNAVIHPSLPMAMMWLNNGTFHLVNKSGEIFGTDQLNKKFKCSYNSEYNDIIKVDLGYKTVYITNRLVPVTKCDIIEKLNSNTWIKM
jgi:hypothetical protein